MYYLTDLTNEGAKYLLIESNGNYKQHYKMKHHAEAKAAKQGWIVMSIEDALAQMDVQGAVLDVAQVSERCTQETVELPSKGAQVGYVRVSTVEQNTDRQLVGVQLDKMFEEKISGKSIDRPQLQAALNYVRAGDTLHIHSLDRVCRSGAGDAVQLVEKLISEGVTVHFHKEGMVFNSEITAAQRGVLGILASVAQMERELIRERQLEGIAAAKAAGKQFGRPKSEVTKGDVLELKAKGVPMTTIAKRLGVGRATVYRLLED